MPGGRCPGLSIFACDGLAGRAGSNWKDGRERTLIELHSAPSIVTAPCNL
jgi:hypothetical protein